MRLTLNAGEKQGIRDGIKAKGPDVWRQAVIYRKRLQDTKNKSGIESWVRMAMRYLPEIWGREPPLEEELGGLEVKDGKPDCAFTAALPEVFPSSDSQQSVGDAIRWVAENLDAKPIPCAPSKLAASMLKEYRVAKRRKDFWEKVFPRAMVGKAERSTGDTSEAQDRKVGGVLDKVLNGALQART